MKKTVINQKQLAALVRLDKAAQAVSFHSNADKVSYRDEANARAGALRELAAAEKEASALNVDVEGEY